MKKLTIFYLTAILAAVVFTLVLPVVAFADDAKLPVGVNEPGNYFASGDQIEVAGTVGSDVYAVGRTVVISGRVDGDVIAIGGRVRITGPVTGNVRVLAGTVELASSVGHNVTVAGGSLELAPGSQVLGHILAAVRELKLSGTVEGTVRAVAQQATLTGTTKGAVELWLDRDGGLLITKSAIVKDVVRYHAAHEASVEAGAQLAHAPELAPLPSQPPASRVGWLIGKLAWLFGLAALAMVIIYLMPKKVQEAAEEALTKPWPSLGWGALWAMAVPIAIILLVFVFIGFPFILVLSALYLLGLVVSQVVVGAAVGWYLRNLPSLKFIQSWKLLPVVLLGLVLYRLLVTIPFVGSLIALLATLWGWGALLRVQRRTVASFN